MTRVRCTLLSLICITAGYGVAQDTLRARVYQTREAFQHRVTDTDRLFVVFKRNTKDLRRNGGNDYRIICLDSDINKRQIKRKIWAIGNGDTAYLNGIPLHLGLGYIQPLNMGRYLCLEAGISGSAKLQRELRKEGLYHPTGGILYRGERYQLKRFLYVYDIELDVMRLLNEKNVAALLQSYPEVLSRFQAEPEKNKQILVQYISLLNSQIKS